MDLKQILSGWGCNEARVFSSPIRCVAQKCHFNRAEAERDNLGICETVNSHNTPLICIYTYADRSALPIGRKEKL